MAATTEKKIILDIGLAAISILGLIATVFVSTGLVNKEIEKRTVYLLVAKPISRAELIVGKHLGLSAVLAVLVAAMTVIYLAILSLSRIPYPVGSILIASLFIWFELSLMAGVGILFGVFSSSLLATLLTFGVYLMGHSTRDLVALGKLTKNPGIEQLMMGLYLVLPDLARFNLRNDAVYGQVPYLAGFDYKCWLRFAVWGAAAVNFDRHIFPPRILKCRFCTFSGNCFCTQDLNPDCKRILLWNQRAKI